MQRNLRVKHVTATSLALEVSDDVCIVGVHVDVGLENILDGPDHAVKIVATHGEDGAVAGCPNRCPSSSLGQQRDLAEELSRLGVVLHLHLALVPAYVGLALPLVQEVDRRRLVALHDNVLATVKGLRIEAVAELCTLIRSQVAEQINTREEVVVFRLPYVLSCHKHHLEDLALEAPQRAGLGTSHSGGSGDVVHEGKFPETRADGCHHDLFRGHLGLSLHEDVETPRVHNVKEVAVVPLLDDGLSGRDGPEEHGSDDTVQVTLDEVPEQHLQGVAPANGLLDPSALLRRLGVDRRPLPIFYPRLANRGGGDAVPPPSALGRGELPPGGLGGRVFALHGALLGLCPRQLPEERAHWTNRTT
mmetsp:Transcript_66197/g.209287  ORF Transcript_66197/g.209287 Transcript_66197/m.209287 type:complete len:361 (+) Transcript_66197:127-1209(+)